MSDYERIRRYRIRKAAAGHRRVDIYLAWDAAMLLDEMDAPQGDAIAEAIRCYTSLYTPKFEQVIMLHRLGKLRALK